MGQLYSFWNIVCRHKYIVTFVLFMLMLTFMDDDSLISRYQRRVVIGQLHEEIDKYQSMYESVTGQLEALDNDPAAVERMARERYHMKRSNEEIYIVANKEAKP